MSKQRRAHSDEFKRKAVRRVETRAQPLTQIARELNISPSLLGVWRKQFGIAPEQSTVSVEEELQRLRRENASLREDREILKKATAFFAKEPR